MIKQLIWTIWTPMSSVLKKADKLNLSLSLSLYINFIHQSSSPPHNLAKPSAGTIWTRKLDMNFFPKVHLSFNDWDTFSLIRWHNSRTCRTYNLVSCLDYFFKRITSNFSLFFQLIVWQLVCVLCLWGCLCDHSSHPYSGLHCVNLCISCRHYRLAAIT